MTAHCRELKVILAVAIITFVLFFSGIHSACAVTLKTVNSELDLPRVDYMMDIEAIFRQAASQDYTTYSRASSDMTLRGGPSSAFGGGDGRTYDSPPFSAVGSLQVHQNSFIEYHFSNVIIGSDGTRYDMIVREDNMRGIRYGSSNNGPYQTVYGFMQDTYNQSWATWSAGDNNAGAVDITFKVVLSGTETLAPEGTMLLAFYDLDQPRPYSSPRPISVDYDWDESVMFDDTSATDGYAYVLPGARLQVVNNNRVKPSNGAPSSSTNTWKEAGVITVGKASGAKVTLQMFSGHGSQTVSTYLFLKPIEYRVDARVVGGGGSVSEPDRPILAKWDYMTKIQADPGYAIDTITVDGKPYSLSNLSNITGTVTTPTSGTLSIPNVLANHHVVVKFRQALGDLVVHKIDATTGVNSQGSATLEGASFALASKDEPTKLIASAITDQNGIAKFSNLISGEYVLTETKAPTGYVLSNPQTPLPVIITPGTKKTITWKNDLGYVYFALQKQDAETGTTAQGSADLSAKGKIIYADTNKPYTSKDGSVHYNPGDVVLEDFSISSTPQVTPNLPYADYKFVEISAGSGYEINSTPITLDAQNGVFVDKVDAKQTIPQTVAVIKNKIKTFDITIDKQDKDTKNKAQGDATFEGAVFAIARASAPQIILEHATTDKNGRTTFHKLISDNYVITEEKAPKGYEINPDPLSISLTDTSEKSFIISDPISQVVFTIAKRDTETGDTPQGSADLSAKGDLILSNESKAIFYNGKLILPGEVVIKDFYFDAKGTTTPKLPYGTYVLHETQAGIGYLPTAPDIILTPEHDGRVFEMPNQVERMNVTIKKVDSQTGIIPQGDATLAGAEFDIVRKSNPDAVVAHITTDDTGIGAAQGLVKNTYLVRETKAPRGYKLNNTPMTIEVSPGQSNTFEFSDDVDTFITTLQKQDAETGTTAQGKAELYGVVDISLASDSNAIVYNGEIYKPGDLILHEVKITTTPIELPYASYVVHEVSAGIGYLASAPNLRLAPSDNGQIIPLVNDVERLTLEVHKVDADTGNTAQGSATFEGAVFSIARKSNPITILSYAITDSSGITYFNDLVMDDYLISEVSAPHGYIREESAQEVNVSPGKPNIFEFKNKLSEVQFTIQNIDAYTGITPQGLGKLEAVGNILLSPDSAPIVYNGEIYKPGDVVVYNFRYNNTETHTPVLPYATYIIHETTAGSGYSLTAPDHVLDPDMANKIIEMPDTPLRFDLKFRKVDALTGRSLAHVAFAITSKTTGETHIIVTDRDGILDTSRSRDTYNTLDHFVDNNEFVGMSDAHASVMFGSGNESAGALLYDIYTITELKSHANVGYNFVSFDLNTTQVGSSIIELADVKDDPIPILVPDIDRGNTTPYPTPFEPETPTKVIQKKTERIIPELVKKDKSPAKEITPTTPQETVPGTTYAKTADNSPILLALCVGLTFVACISVLAGARYRHL